MSRRHSKQVGKLAGAQKKNLFPTPAAVAEAAGSTPESKNGLQSVELHIHQQSNKN
jgi:hypothetical protein